MPSLSAGGYVAGMDAVGTGLPVEESTEEDALDEGAPSAPTPPRFGARVTRWPLIVAFGIWTLFVWINRIRNIWSDLLLSTDERVWLSAIAASFIVLGIATVFIGLGLRKYALTRGDVITIGILAGWTTGVWLARGVEIATDDANSGPFIAVHLALGLISIALGALSWRAVAGVRHPGPPPGSAGADVPG